MNKYIFPIIKWKIKSWLKYYILNKSATSYPLSEITTGTSPLTLSNSVRKKFNIFNVGGNTVQNGEPTPETPVPVQNVSGEVEVKVGNGTDSTAEGYEEQTATLHLPAGMEMCKIPNTDYADSFEKREGNWYKNKKIGKVVLDSTGDWSGAALDATTWRFTKGVTNLNSIAYEYGVTDGYCNYFKYLMQYSGSTNIERVYTNSNSVWIITKVALTVNDWEAWLNNHELTIYYRLKEPVLEEITDPTLISDLESLKNLYSYKGTTYISSTNEPSPVFEVQYYMEEGA